MKTWMATLLAALFVTRASTEFACDVTVNTESTWFGSVADVSVGAVELLVQNVGTTDVTVPYEVLLENPLYQTVNTAWNVQDLRTEPGIVTGVCKEPWQDLYAQSDNMVELGYVLQITDTAEQNTTADSFLPTFVSINGTECTVSLGNTTAPGEY
jgi:hypothetical protein